MSYASQTVSGRETLECTDSGIACKAAPRHPVQIGVAGPTWGWNRAETAKESPSIAEIDDENRHVIEEIIPSCEGLGRGHNGVQGRFPR